MGNFFSLNSTPSNDLENNYRECENSDCYEEIINEVNEAFFQLNSIDGQNENYLLKLANELEDILNDTTYLCLDNLEKPIKEAATSLKNVNLLTNSELNDQHVEAPCNCREWGPDIFVDGKWICNKCQNKCKCDEQDWENIYQSHNNENKKICEYVDDEDNKIRSCVKSTSISDCDSFSWNENESIDVPLDATSYLEIIRKEKLPEETEQNIVEEKDGIYCPCGCGLYQKGDFLMCPCGCNNFIEIVDDLDNITINERHCSEDGTESKCDSFSDINN